MMGQQHKKFAVPFGAMFAALLIGVLGFGIEYVLVVPLCWYFAVFPDIDQPVTNPKDTDNLKSLWTTIMWLTPMIAMGTLAYFGYRAYKGFDIMGNIKEIGIAAGVVVLGFLLNLSKKNKYTKFLWGHRGFTHTLVVPAGLLVLYNQLNKMANTVKPEYQILIHLAGILIAGLFAGIVCHIFLDMTCKSGVPILFPLTKKNISIGNAITSDPNPKRQGQPHKSSIITTNFWSFVCIVLTGLIIWKYYPNILFQLKCFKF